MEQQKIPKQPTFERYNLEKMFNVQEKFQDRFYNFNNMTDKEKIEYQRLMLTCISIEAMEALDWLNWKPWKKTKKKFNRYEFLNELIDIQHFLINSAIGVGCDSKEFEELYGNKHKENINRQERGY